MTKEAMIARRCRNVSKNKREQTYRLDGYQCVYCGLADQLTIDHVVPVSVCVRTIHRSVVNKGKNLLTACTPCNNRRDVGEGALLNHGRFAGQCVPFREYYHEVLSALIAARSTLPKKSIHVPDLRAALWVKRQTRIHPKTKEVIETLIPIS